MATTKSPTSERAESPSGICHFGLEVAAVLQRDGDLGGVLDDVRVGDDVAAAGVENHPGAGALERPLPRSGIGRHVEEAAEKGIIEQRVLRAAFADGAARGDVHHRRRDLLDHRRERRQRRIADRRRHRRQRGRRGSERHEQEGKYRALHARGILALSAGARFDCGARLICEIAGKNQSRRHRSAAGSP
jgi:hypothetical protein